MYIVRPTRRSDEDTYGTAEMMLTMTALAVAVPGPESVGGMVFILRTKIATSVGRRLNVKQNDKYITGALVRVCVCVRYLGGNCRLISNCRPDGAVAVYGDPYRAPATEGGATSVRLGSVFCGGATWKVPGRLPP